MSDQLDRVGCFEVDLPSGKLSVTRKPPSSDRRRILVVFSGFRKAFTVDLGGDSLAPVRNEIFWIHDVFGIRSKEGYYIAADGDYGPSILVKEFFELLAEKRKVKYSEIVTTGFSKGGSAALYFALEFGLGGCVIGVPQLRMASYVKYHWPEVHEAMTRGSEVFTEELDGILHQSLQRHKGSKVPVYLLSSEDDPQFFSEIEPNLPSFQALTQFNLVMVDSVFVSKHIDVTPYCVPIIQALLLLLLDGLVPQVGEVQIGWQVDRRPRIDQPNTVEAWCVGGELREGTFFPKLDTFVRGMPIDEYGQWKRVLRIGDQRVQLGSEIHEELSKKYYAVDYVNYRAARSVSFKNRGIDIREISDGRHPLMLELTRNGESQTHVTSIKSTRVMHDTGNVGRRIVRFCSDSEGAELELTEISDVRLVPTSDVTFLDECTLDAGGCHLNLRGRLLDSGMIAMNWGDLKYTAIFDDGESLRSIALGMLSRPGPGIPRSAEKAYYSDMKLAGIPLDQFPDGEYGVAVVVSTPWSIASSGNLCALRIRNGRGDLRVGAKPTWATTDATGKAHIESGPRGDGGLTSVNEQTRMRPDPVTVECAAYSDERGNRIICEGDALNGCVVTFRGYDATVLVRPGASVTKLSIDFNGDGGRFIIGANPQRRSFSASVRVGQDSTVDIGAGVSSTSPVIISAVEGTTVRVGDDVMFASQNQVRADDGHPIFDVRSGKRVNPAEDIVIGDHVWLAWGATVLGGARVGSGTVLGAFSLLTKEVPNNCVVVGSPARVVRRDIAWERPHLGLAEPFYKPDASTVTRSIDYWKLTEE